MRRTGVLLAVLPFLSGLAPATAQAPLGPPCPSKTMAFYYPWYGGPPDYRHWRNATGEPQYEYDPPRTISSANYPVLGPYDSRDPAVIDRHLAWAQDAGIDVLISSWWGPGGFEDEALRLILDRIEATGSPVRAAVYLETWGLFYNPGLGPRFFTDPRNFTPDSRAEIRSKASSWLAHVLTNHGHRPAYLRATKDVDVPVVFVYSAALFDPVEWEGIFEDAGAPAFYQGDVEGADFQAQGRVFDGLHLYTPSHLTGEGWLSFAERIRDPRGSRTNPAAPYTDPVTVGADYQAWAAEARALGRSWAATVIPGFDDRKVRNPSFVVSRDHGVERTYDYFWRQALESRPDWVLITSFNEWHEGSEIEPSVEHGDEFLVRTRLWSDRVRPGCFVTHD